MNKSTLLKTALIISLSLNLLVAGVFIGRKMDTHGPGGMHFRSAMDQVDQATHQKLRASMRAQFRDTKDLRQALRSAQRELEEQVETEPFDSVAAEDAFEKVRLAANNLQQAMHQHMIKNLAQLTPEERISVFKTISQRGPKHLRPGPPNPNTPNDPPPHPQEEELTSPRVYSVFLTHRPKRFRHPFAKFAKYRKVYAPKCRL